MGQVTLLLALSSETERAMGLSAAADDGDDGSGRRWEKDDAAAAAADAALQTLRRPIAQV